MKHGSKLSNWRKKLWA